MTALTQVQQVDMPFAIQNLINAYNQEVAEHDDLLSERDELAGQVDRLQRLNAKLQSDIDHQSGEMGWLEVGVKELEEKLEASNVEAQTLRERLSDSERKVSELSKGNKKDSKQSKREANQVKRLKESAKKYQTRSVTLERDLKESDIKRTALAKELTMLVTDYKLMQEKIAKYRITPIYVDDGEALLVLPFTIQTSIGDGKPKEVVTLLHTRKGGVFRQVALNQHNEPNFSTIYKGPHSTFSDKTYQTANKLLDEPSDKVKELAKKWLYKVNVTQKGYMLFEDIDLNASK
ncbi:hypothetical protein AB6E53_02480 [Vibrio breoganii]|uniref:Uncharacterized protein n=1 Tax=Vibrio breoganii TaxID=553239 RepID=A0AAP8SWI9_9VIBR|nr:hypothetical protein [Vibrio breoganii]PMP10253.1 hypothetical protein BCS93_11295 [Vibrio breoganii]